MKHLKSLGEFLDALKQIEDLQEIDQEIEKNLEMGAVTRRSMDLRAPAPLFNRIKGVEPDFRAFGAIAPAHSAAYRKTLGRAVQGKIS